MGLSGFAVYGTAGRSHNVAISFSFTVREGPAMSDNYYAEIFLHIVWHTKFSAAMLTEEVEAMVFGALREKAARLGDVYIHELGAVPDHIHLAVGVEPTVKPSEIMGAL